MTDTFPRMHAVFFFLILDAEDTTCYHISVLWSCNVALWVEVWDYSLLIDE